MRLQFHFGKLQNLESILHFNGVFHRFEAYWTGESRAESGIKLKCWNQSRSVSQYWKCLTVHPHHAVPLILHSQTQVSVMFLLWAHDFDTRRPGDCHEESEDNERSQDDHKNITNHIRNTTVTLIRQADVGRFCPELESRDCDFLFFIQFFLCV